MTNLLQQAINCDDADRAARASKGDDVVNYRFPTTWPDDREQRPTPASSRDHNGQALAYLLAALLSADAQRTVRCFYLIRTFRPRPSRETNRTFGRFDGDAACRSVGIVDELVELNARLRADFEIAIIVKAQARDAADAGLYVILMVDVAAGGQRVLAAVRAFRLRSDRGGAADGLLPVGGAR